MKKLVSADCVMKKFKVKRPQLSWVDLSKNHYFCLNVHFKQKYTDNGKSEASHINYILLNYLYMCSLSHVMSFAIVFKVH